MPGITIGTVPNRVEVCQNNKRRRQSKYDQNKQAEAKVHAKGPLAHQNDQKPSKDGQEVNEQLARVLNIVAVARARLLNNQLCVKDDVQAEDH